MFYSYFHFFLLIFITRHVNTTHLRPCLQPPCPPLLPTTSLRHSNVQSLPSITSLPTQHAETSIEFIRRLRRKARIRHKLHRVLNIKLKPAIPKPTPIPTPKPKPKTIPNTTVIPSKPLPTPPLAPSPQKLPPTPLPQPLSPISTCPPNTISIPCKKVCIVHDSIKLTTSCDTTKTFPTILKIGGELILINTSLPTHSNIIHQATIIDPHTDDTIAFNVPYLGRSSCETDVIEICVPIDPKICLLDGLNEYLLLDPCINTLDQSVFVRTSKSWSDLNVLTGDMVRIDEIEYVVETPRDDHVVTISHPWHLTNKTAATTTTTNNNNNSSNSNLNCTTTAYRKKKETMLWNDRPVMSCCISTTMNSNIGTITGKLKNQINNNGDNNNGNDENDKLKVKIGDVIGIRNEAFRIIDIQEDEIETYVTFSDVSKRTTCTGMIPKLIDTCQQLTGQAVLSFNSSIVVTTNDLSNQLQSKDRVAFDSSSYSGTGLTTETWSINNEGVTKNGFDLSSIWERSNTGYLNIYQCSTSTCESVVENCPKVILKKGTTLVNTECDISTVLEKDDDLLLCGVLHKISEISINGDTITLVHPWLGRRSDPSVKEERCEMCKLPKTEAQEIMTEYNEKYGRCKSVLCMAKLEAEEKKLGENFIKIKNVNQNSIKQEEDKEQKQKEEEIIEENDEIKKNKYDVSIATGDTFNKNDAEIKGNSDSSHDSSTPIASSTSSTSSSKSSTSSITTTSSTSSITKQAKTPTLNDEDEDETSTLIKIPNVQLSSDGTIVGGISEDDEDSTLLNSIKGPLANILNNLNLNPDEKDEKDQTKEDDKKDKKDKKEKITPPEVDEEEEEEEEEGDELDDDLDEDGTPTNSPNGDTTPKPKSGTDPDPKLPKHEQDAFDATMKPSKVPPGSSKTFKRFMKCELCGKDNDVMNPLFMLNPSEKAPPSSEEYMKKKMKAAETMDAQSTPPGYQGPGNKPWHKAADEMSSNHASGIKFCPDDWLDLGVGDHVYPIDSAGEPVGHKCKNLLNIGKCKEPDSMIVDIAITKGFGIEMAGTFVEDFTKKKYKGWYGKYQKCNFARECRTPWKGFDHLCGVTRKWLKKTEQNYAHRFNDAISDEHPVEWPE